MELPWNKDKLDAKIKRAVDFYWRTREDQKKKQAEKGKSDTGTRSEATGGKQLDAFAKIIREIGSAAGYAPSEMYGGTQFPVPGYYRAQKDWDVVFVRNGKLVAVVELKSLTGKTGKNTNNRAEEVLGVAHDFWHAYREKLIGLPPPPWTGYFFLLERDGKEEKPVRMSMRKSFLKPMEIFDKASYIRRYEILCERLMLERDYSAASLLVSTKDGEILERGHEELSFASFCRSLYCHLIANS